MVDTVVKVFLDFFLFFSQRYIVALSCRGFVRRYYLSRINKLRFSKGIYIFVGISSVFSLALSGAKNTIFIIPSFFRLRYAPFHNGKSLVICLTTLYYIQGSISLSDCVHRINHFFKLLPLNLNTVSIHITQSGTGFSSASFSSLLSPIRKYFAASSMVRVYFSQIGTSLLFILSSPFLSGSKVNQ